MLDSFAGFIITCLLISISFFQMRFFFLFLNAVLIQFNGFAQTSKQADAVNGIWLTGSKEGKIEIFRGVDGRYHGKIIWLKEPVDEDGKPKLDKENPDLNRRKFPILGLQIMRGFRYDSENVWVDGKIYDPERGSDYRCKMTLVNENTLNVRGFVGMSLFGRTDTWNRIPEKK